MKQDESDQRRNSASRGASRLTESIPDKGRRSFLRVAMAHGVAAPFALASIDPAGAATRREDNPASPAYRRKGSLRHGKQNLPLGKQNGLEPRGSGAIVRDFADPYLELLRLLREAAEIEHALMLQYLYCTFSLKDRYQELIGNGVPASTDLMGVAIQEMQHLGAVNRLLVALGSCPHLDRQDFPYEPDIYPFPFQLEPLSRSALAKYVFTEGPASIFAASGQRAPDDERFRSNVLSDIGGLDRPNHVGSLYQTVLDLLSEAADRPGFPLAPAEVDQWRSDLADIMHQGEVDHFEFFRQVYEGRHPAFAAAGVSNVWELPPDHDAYPAHPAPLNPTAYVGHPNQIASEDALAIAWLGNLHYWIALCCLDFSYRHADQGARNLSQLQMMTALWPLAAELPQHGAGVPFDPLSMGYALGAGKEQSRTVILAFAREAQAFSRTVEAQLPAGYAKNNTDFVIQVLGG